MDKQLASEVNVDYVKSCYKFIHCMQIIQNILTTNNLEQLKPSIEEIT